MPTSEGIYTVNVCGTQLTASILRWGLDKFGESARFRGNKAQHAAYDYLMLYFAEQKLPPEVNLDLARRFGLYPSRFDLDERVENSTILVTVDGQVLARIESLAIPVRYAD